MQQHYGLARDKPAAVTTHAKHGTEASAVNAATATWDHKLLVYAGQWAMAERLSLNGDEFLSGMAACILLICRLLPIADTAYLVFSFYLTRTDTTAQKGGYSCNQKN